MLLSLNDDCLMHICKYLNLTDQASLAHVCQRLQQIVEYNWSYRYKKVDLDFHESCFFSEHIKYFNEFISCICQNVEDFSIESWESTKLTSWQTVNFPKTISFTLHGHGGEQTDEEIQEIGRVFPILKKFSLAYSNATGKYLWNLKSLNELDLESCYNLDTKYFKRIFSTLPLKKLDIMECDCPTFDELAVNITECKTLEELHIDDNVLIFLLKGMTKLKKLRKLVVLVRNDGRCLKELGTLYETTMETMIFQMTFYCQHKIALNLQNLAKLIIHGDYIFEGQMEMVGRSVGKTLKEFRCIDGFFKRVGDGEFIAFLRYCKKLEIFDISSSYCDVNWRNVISTLSDDFKNRKQLLRFPCYNTIAPADAELLSIPNRLEFVLTKEDIEPTLDNDYFYFQCEFNVQNLESL